MPDGDEFNSYGWTTKQVNDVWRIDLSGADGFTWHPLHTVGDAPAAREGHTAVLLADRYVVIHGGYSYAGSYHNDTHVLDTQAEPMAWSQPVLSGDAPSARHGHSAVLLGDEIFYFGGTGTQGHSSEIYVLQLAATLGL